MEMGKDPESQEPQALPSPTPENASDEQLKAMVEEVFASSTQIPFEQSLQKLEGLTREIVRRKGRTKTNDSRI